MLQKNKVIITDAELIEKIKNFRPEFGNMDHVDINEKIGKLKRLLKQKQTPSIRSDIELLKRNIIFVLDGKKII